MGRVLPRSGMKLRPPEQGEPRPRPAKRLRASRQGQPAARTALKSGVPRGQTVDGGAGSRSRMTEGRTAAPNTAGGVMVECRRATAWATKSG